MSLEDLTTDQLLQRARQTESSHNLLSTLLNDPASREMIQRQMKKANPSLSIPEIDAKDAVMNEVNGTRKQIQELEARILERDVRERLERDRAAVKTKYKLNEADINAIEGLMTDQNNPIPTYDAAARVHVASKQTAVPTPSSIVPQVYEMPERDVWGKGIGNPAELNKIALREAYEALNDIKAGKVAGLGPAQ